MIQLADYVRYDGLGLAELVRKKEVKPGELVEAALAAVGKVNPQINAVLQTLPDEAAADLRRGSTGPFAGVPLLIKELILHAKGVRCDSGSRLAQGFVAEADTELMARFRRAGFLLVGTTQTPELGYNPTTETVLFGPVRNPWDLGRSAGGSSGGAGAAVAAGIVPIGHASDGGGSIRIPASANGLVGLKPTRDRIPAGPDYADPLSGLATELAVTRTIRDAAALLDAVAGADVGAPSHPVPPARPWSKEVGADPGRLRIAWTTRAASGARSDPECVAAVENTVKTLASLGHEVVEDAPRYDWEMFLRTVHPIWTTFTAFFVEALIEATGRRAEDHLEAVTVACWEDGKRTTAVELHRALAHHNVVSRQVGEFFQTVDLLITPTMAKPAPPLGELDQNRRGMSAFEWTEQVFTYCPFTPLFNTTGQPAMSLPLHWTAVGFPVGVQLAARFGDEATLIRVGSQLEQVMPWKDRRPPVHAGAA